MNDESRVWPMNATDLLLLLIAILLGAIFVFMLVTF